MYPLYVIPKILIKQTLILKENTFNSIMHLLVLIKIYTNIYKFS